MKEKIKTKEILNTHLSQVMRPSIDDCDP